MSPTSGPVMKLIALAAFGATLLAAAQAHAEPVLVRCADEDVMTAGWDSPLTLTYAGEATGDVTIASEHLAFTVPASRTEQSGGIDISGFAETTSIMPDQAELLACAAQSIQPEFKDDADMEAVAIMGCVPKAKPAAQAVKIVATVRLGILPAQGSQAADVILELKRRYVDVKTPAGRDLAIETFPKDCRITTP